jgi:hypothetical protein
MYAENLLAILVKANLLIANKGKPDAGYIIKTGAVQILVNLQKKIWLLLLQFLSQFSDFFEPIFFRIFFKTSPQIFF